jgi:hypothetical protein
MDTPGECNVETTEHVWMGPHNRMNGSLPFYTVNLKVLINTKTLFLIFLFPSGCDVEYPQNNKDYSGNDF